MRFLKLPLPPPSLHLNHNHSSHRSISFQFHPHTFTLPSFFRHKFTSSKRLVSSILQTSNSDSCPTEHHHNLIPHVRIVAVVGEGALSPLKSASWLDVMIHTAERLKWVDDQYEMLVFTDNISKSNQKELTTAANILLVVSVTNPEPVEWIRRYSQKIPNVICFDSSPALENKLGGSFVNKKTKETAKTISESWIRYNSDDIRFCLLLIINSYIKPVPVLKNLRAQGFSTLNCMVKNCGIQVLNCLLDPNCRKALQCLNQCSPVDQVCNYQCIASYESPILEEFSLCILQKHNCLDLDAKIPEKPVVPPMVKFRDEPLSHEIAEDLFIGWLGKMEWSWRVVAGQNPAYDQFPCQYQLFYRGKAKGSFWYEPVFQVKTLDGKLVWRRRKYRVKRGKVVGTFHFSVLDNGVVSNENWTIVDVADDLSWGLFHYSGAARVAGQSYTGAVLVSPNGEYPNDSEKDGLLSALGRCCIKEWELFDVDNCSCSNPPLGLPEGSRLHTTAKIDNLKR
ncbi:hypothetical protein L6452_32438 [Arctium lappa]|uniref:Uncharacterized protein n=1 Tax=Arctium lappa TaxID=4217 RepID=A0ACB8Z4Y5_ARCLA|nr:hypothetical protein L6452_32438 [Arctium lappa]